jgi:hypothetical protein
MGFAEAYDNALHHQRIQELKASSERTSPYQTSVTSSQFNKRKREEDQSVRVQMRSGI